MPQMKPFHWTMSLMLISFLLIIYTSMIYYSYFPFINQFNDSSSIHNITINSWNWKW